MVSSTKTLFGVAALATTVLGHGYVIDPPARKPGPAMAAACGQQMFNNQNSDIYGNIQGELQVARNQADFDASKCNVWQCKGFQLADSPAQNVQSFRPGQVVPMTVEIRAPHEGTANVSIVSTASNTVIGSGPLISWDVYASNAAPIPADQTKFDVTIPEDIGGQCAQPGDCVLQWYWDARSIDQTYEACVDFVVGGGGGGGDGQAPAPSSPPPVASPTAPLPTSSASPTASSATSSAAPTPTAAPQDPVGGGSGSGDGSVPESFTLDTFIAWLRTKAGGNNARRHARQLM
ncbi:chitin binding domain-containing protein [Microdochium trichocladiopsis]|uniref:Chitin binding domain-containing protein n=1 Tax=Microdochium trichocladiopsis TaxID=1682393 RepID=A0A9P8YHZ3_9PEZI|nr:chitin binding domain-containing protein [Microdochium trichocladiopsis]KAH7040625.1 chitin binding domain-containing protein [Microdochium trichocladiopsis]